MTRRESWLPQFRRAIAFLRPHRRLLFMGLLAALGVSVFYTFSISSIVPLLKVVFADHETLVDWLHRVETQRRLGVIIAADLPFDPAGLVIDHVRDDSRSRGVLSSGDRIVSVGGEVPGSYGLMRLVAAHPEKKLAGVVLENPEGQRREVALRLRSYHWWSHVLESVTSWLPTGKDPGSRLLALTVVMTALVLLSLLGGVCRFANEGLVATAVQRGMHDLRSRLADHVLRLPLDWYNNQPHGDVIGRFATDISKVEIGLSTLFGKVIREPLKAVGVITLTLLIDWKLMLVALVGLPVGAIVMRGFGRMVKKAQRHASQSWGRLLDHLGERLTGVRVVKAYNMQAAESRRFEQEGRTLTRAQTHIELADAATNPALETLAMMAVGAFVLYGGNRVFNHELEPHLFFTAVICLGGIFDPVRKMGNVNNRLQQADASSRRLFELMDLPTEERVASPRSLAVLPPFRDSIEFCDLSFAYPSRPEHLVLSALYLKVTKGQMVALVGPNGSGKTTLVSLLLRFFEPTRGRILIDGHDIAGVTLESLRAQIGLVTQDAVIFSDTVSANIAYGANGVTAVALRDAARLAHVDDFIQSLSVQSNGRETRGYDALISARSLSGGQRQRIALARAILRDPPILVLDEATSQVDSESERKIQEALDDVTRGRTTFIIAHRYSTIARSDVTVVLSEGRIIAVGRHAELLQTCPFYVSLCETQFAHTV